MKKLNVLLVDDDRIILDDIQNIMDWEGNGFHIVATAYNGKKALELYQKLRPEIIITDIKMPIMDGMQLLEAVREISEETKILLLTSYKEFEYAKRAIEQNISDYQLKNDISEETFLKKMLSIKAEIESAARLSSISVQQALHELFIGSGRISTGYSAHVLQVLQMPCYFMLTDICTPVALGVSPVEQELTGVAEALRRIQPTQSEILFTHALGPYQILIALQPAGANVRPSDFYAEAANLACAYIFERYGWRSAYGYVIKRMDTVQFSRLFRSSIAGRHDAAFLAQNAGFDLSRLPAAFSADVYSQIIRQLRATLEGVEKGPVREAVGIFFELVFGARDFAALYDFCNQAYGVMEEYWSEHLAALADAGPAATLLNAEDLKRWLIDAVGTAALHRRQISNRAYSKSTQDAIRYIEGHYGDSELTISKIAQTVALSTGRLSVLFKKETDVTVNEYITKVRIDRACELLRNTNLKIYEVAANVGYGSSQYFSQIFLHVSGMKPGDYRKQS